MTERTRWTVVIVVSIVVGLIVLCCLASAFGERLNVSMMPGRWQPFDWQYGPGDSGDLGALTYLTGLGENGRIVPVRGGAPGLGRYGLGCAACHGPDGRGGVRLPMLDRVPPDIRYATLTQSVTREGSRRSRYTDETIRRAVVQGVDADGKRLSNSMPRYVLRDAELETLLDWIKKQPSGTP